MRLRGVRLTVAVVAVVPERDEPQVPDGREHRGTGPDHGPYGTPPHGEPLPVPLLGSGVGGEHGVPSLPENGGQGGVDPYDGTPVRHDDQGPAP